MKNEETEYQTWTVTEFKTCYKQQGYVQTTNPVPFSMPKL